MGETWKCTTDLFNNLPCGKSSWNKMLGFVYYCVYYCYLVA